MRWSQLIVGSGLAPRWEGPVDPDITTVEEDSRQVRPGACFVAVRGTRLDGNEFVDSALRAGASAVVSERRVALPDSIAGFQAPSVQGVAGRLAAVLHGLDHLQRDGRLKTVGVTGTNGKSTTCYLVRSIFQAAGRPTALLGTIQYDLLSRVVEAPMTTPPAPALMAYLAEAVRAGASHAVMEASSHALDQGRCDGIRFAVGVFTNLTGDHLDYHHGMATYLRAKKRLFDHLDAEGIAVVNQDDPSWRRMVAGCPARVIRFAVAGAPGDRGEARCRRARGAVEAGGAQIYARVREITAAGTRFELVIRGEDLGGGGGTGVHEVASPLLGRHNVQNSLAAAGAALALGISPEAVVTGLLAMRCVPGRLQRVVLPTGPGAGPPRDPGFTVLVDYAHTDDALANVLAAVRPLTAGKLIVLFGCGGDRDRTKRPRMASVVAQVADRIVVTSDNPRTEDPHRIIEEILTGFAAPQRSCVEVEPDRRRAIVRALALADPGDVVLLAGKGHETYQEIGRERFPFDDAAVAAGILSKSVFEKPPEKGTVSISPGSDPRCPPRGEGAAPAFGRNGDSPRASQTRSQEGPAMGRDA